MPWPWASVGALATMAFTWAQPLPENAVAPAGLGPHVTANSAAVPAREAKNRLSIPDLLDMPTDDPSPSGRRLLPRDHTVRYGVRQIPNSGVCARHERDGDGNPRSHLRPAQRPPGAAGVLRHDQAPVRAGCPAGRRLRQRDPAIHWGQVAEQAGR